MKFSISRLGIIALATTLGIVINSRSANAANFSFSQTGWGNGGTVNGTFSGQDTNNNGIISFLDGEVSAYGMTFSGNTNIPSFFHTLSNIIALNYNLSNGTIGTIISSTVSSGGFTYNGNFNVGSIIGQINNNSGSLTTTTSSTVQVTNIPNIPEGNSLMGLTAVTLMGGLTLRRRFHRMND